MIPLEWRKWMVLVATIWIQAFTGTNFDFPSYSSQLKSVLEITQVQLNYLSMASDLGKLFGWCSGVFLLYFPTWVVLSMAAFLGLFGYGLQWLLIQRLISLSYLMAFMLCLSAGCSITWFNTVCYVLCIKNFPANWPLAVSLSVSFNGVTAALYNLIVNKLSTDDKNTAYLILNAFLPFVTSIAALVPILQQPSSRKGLQTDDTANKDDAYTFLILYVLAAVAGLYLFIVDTVSQNLLLVGILLLVLPLVSPKIVHVCKWVHQTLHSEAHPGEGPSYNLVQINDHELVEECPASISKTNPSGSWVFDKIIEKDRLVTLGEEHTARMLAARYDFWLYYMAYFCGGTIGLVYSNNLGQIAQSLGYISKTKALVTLYSTCTFFGRLISATPDLVGCFYPTHIYTKGYATRTGWLALSLVPMPVAFFVLLLSGSETALGAATGLIGICSGFIFSAAVSITSELFGSNSSGINHNILITNIPLGSMLYGLHAALIYDKHIKSSKEVVLLGGSMVCMGRKCYHETFTWWGCISVLGLASSLLLFLRTKAAYEEYYESKRYWTSSETAFTL